MNRLILGTALAALVVSAGAPAGDLGTESQATAYYKIPFGETRRRDGEHRLGFRLDRFRRGEASGRSTGVRWQRPASMDVSFTRTGFDALSIHGRKFTSDSFSANAEESAPVLGIPNFVWGVIGAGVLGVIIAKETEEDNDAPR